MPFNVHSKKESKRIKEFRATGTHTWIIRKQSGTTILEKFGSFLLVKYTPS